MNKNSKLAVSLLAAMLPISGGALATEVSPYIVNGSTASVTEFPSIATLFYDRIDYDGIYGTASYCGGTLLDAQHILTAAHCLYDGNGNLDENYLLFTSVVPQLENEGDFPNGNIQRVMGEEYYVHPNYSDSSDDLWANDIAIIKLASSLNINATSDAIQRPADETYRGNNTFKALGHGRTTDTTNPVGPLLETTLTYETNATCASSYSGIPDTNICFSGAFNGGTGLSNSTCQGDSGGPVYWQRGVNDWVQVGITSFGPTNCGTGAITSVFTEIYDYRTWIDSVVAGSQAASFTATDTKRNTYLNATTDTGNSSSSSSDGGGSLPLWALVGLGLLFTRRRN